jgi:CheY-like chemotaxis protein
MPVMDGITAARLIKQLSRNHTSSGAPLQCRRPYIIACTADLQSRTREACQEAGFDAFLEKVTAPGALPFLRPLF